LHYETLLGLILGNLTYYFCLLIQPVKVPNDIVVYLFVPFDLKQYYVDKYVLKRSLVQILLYSDLITVYCRPTVIEF